MSEKIRKLKEEASRLTANQKLAELYARMGKIHESVVEYQAVAGSYAADGLLLKAIAVCKIILQIDPNHKETQHILADLSTKRRGESVAVEMPKSMSSA